MWRDPDVSSRFRRELRVGLGDVAPISASSGLRYPAGAGFLGREGAGLIWWRHRLVGACGGPGELQEATRRRGGGITILLRAEMLLLGKLK